MSKKRMAVLATVLVALGLTAGSVLPLVAQEDPPPIAVELLTGRSEFTDDVNLKFRYKLDGLPTRVINSSDPSRTVVARITVQPGAQFPWHTHSGPVIVNITQGELVYVNASDCVERHYPADTVFLDPGRGNVHTAHTAFNPDNGETVLVATFFEVSATGPLSITEGVEAPADCQIEVGQHAH